MYDIQFVEASHLLKRAIVEGHYVGDAGAELERLRSKVPKVFQLETTNVCNLTCVMCPRTTEMKRPLVTMPLDVFGGIVEQLSPHESGAWEGWRQWVEREGMLRARAIAEDEFYFMICAKTLILHGFGEPILDKELPQKIALASARGLPTYFSMNPVNAFPDKLDAVGAAGLGYLKFSLEGLDNATQKRYRGRIDKDFATTLRKITDTLDLFARKGHSTQVILTKLNFKDDLEAQQEYLDFWSQYPVMAYVKNQHNRWLYEEEGAPDNSAEYVQRYCEFPWTSLSILANGTVVPCPIEYDGILNMGNVRENSLEEIWNSDQYAEFRRMHATGDFPVGHFCNTHCDYHKLHEFSTRNRGLAGTRP